MSEFSRRDFLKLTRDGFLYLSGALALGGVIRFLDFDLNPAPQTKFELGPAANFPLGTKTPLAEVPVLLIHADQGFIALSLTCTHLGCTLEPNQNGFACPCHNSAFDEDGNVTHGPAVLPLKKLRIEITADDKLILYTE
jgi:Rieske Fe-S protein